MLERIRQDVRFAARSLLRTRGVTIIAIASLAIGIAANTTIFSLVQAIEFPSLIYPDAARIVFLESKNDARGLVGMPVSAPDALDVAASSRTIELASLAADQSSVLRVGTTAKRVSGRRVTAAFFDVLRVPPQLGRTLLPNDTQDVIVISDSLWRNEFASDAAIVTRPVQLDGGIVTIVGVMPARFDADADLWVPLASLSGFRRDDRQFTLFGRLAPDASLNDAVVECAAISRRLAADYSATNKDWTMFPVRLTRMHGRDSRGAFILLQAAVGFVLLIACANIANILLARGTTKRHELAVRLALGASRARLVGALLVESILLAVTGGVLGVVLSMWGIRFARAFGGFPEVIDPRLNVLVLGFSVVLSVLTGVLCGVVPALRASNVSPEPVLRAEGGRGAVVESRGWLRSGLVAAQIAAALVLATCGGLLIRSFANRAAVDLGFEPHGTIRADLAMSSDRYYDPAAVRAGADAILERLRRSPDVAAAGIVTWALPTGAGAQRQFTAPSEKDRALAPSVRRGVEAVTPEYFAALRVPVRMGRILTDADGAGTTPSAVINEELARQMWPGRNPVGELLQLGAPGESAPVVTVVGVVGTIRRSAMHDVPVARAYVPFAQHPNRTVTVVVRARGEIAAASRALEAAVHDTDGSLLVEGLRTMDAEVAQFVAPLRLITALLGGFAAAGLLLAGLGVFGTMSYTVSQREREMAVRSALGAARQDILRLVFGSALRITAAGMLAGVLAAFAATSALRSFLFGVSPLDPLTFGLAIVFLSIASLAACYRPARTAASVDPMVVLRQ